MLGFATVRPNGLLAAASTISVVADAAKTDDLPEVRRLIKEHADGDVLVLPAHFPAPTCGHIKSHGGAYRFDFRA